MKMPNSILLMMNSEEDFSHYKALVHEVISPECSVDWVADHDASMEIVTRNTHDLWVIDGSLGLDIIGDVVRQGMKIGARAPFVILHDDSNYDHALEALKLGAADALNKHEATPAEFSRCVKHAIARHRYVSLERQASDQLVVQNQELSDLCKTAQEYAGHVSYKIRTPLTVIKAFAAILADGVAGQLNTKQIEHLKKIIGRVDDLSDMLGEMIKSEKARALGSEAPSAIKIKIPASVLPASSAPIAAAIKPPAETPPAVMSAPPPPAMSDTPPAVMSAPPPPAMSDTPPAVMSAPPPPAMSDTPPAVMSAPPPPAMSDTPPAVMSAPLPPAMSDTPPAVMSAPPPPAMEASPASAAPTSGNQPIRATEVPVEPTHTVLIVDDDPTIIEVFSMLIENLGFNVITATNGRDGFAQFASKNVDLLILDLGIPGDDGLSIYQKILDLEFAELERTPAILLTGSSDENSISRSANVGARYILKDGNAWDNVHAALKEIFNLGGDDEQQSSTSENSDSSSMQATA